MADNPRLAFLRVVAAFFAPARPSGIHPTAAVDPEAEIGRGVYIGPYACIGRCRIGEGTVIHGHVHVYPDTGIGRNVTIHSGAVIGADGFGYERNEAGALEKFPQIGRVVIEDEVEIGANACIDRATLGATLIGRGSKLDDLVYVAHNVRIGRDAVVVARAALCGSARIGDRAWIGAGATVRDKVSVGAGATVGLGAAVVADVAEGSTVAGVPARPVPPGEGE